MKFWLKLKTSSNCIINSCLSELTEINDDWITNIKDELCKLGLAYIWNNVNNVCYNKNTFSINKHRFTDLYQQELLSNLATTSRGHLYQHLVDHHCLQYYLCKPIPQVYRRYISRFRLSSHNLKIESDRYTNIERNNRICTLCDLADIEDEFHFILICPLYNDLRNSYIKKYYYRTPCVFKLVQLLSCNNVTELCKLGKYLKLASERRILLLH